MMLVKFSTRYRRGYMNLSDLKIQDETVFGSDSHHN